MKSAVIVASGITAASAFNLFPRQNDETCVSALSEAQSVLESYPPIPTDEAFLKFVFDQDLPTGEEASNACFIPAVSGEPSHVATYSSFIAQVTSWIGENRDTVASVYSACESNSIFRSVIDEFGLPDEASSLCETFTIETLVSGSATPTSAPSSVPASTTGSAAAESTAAPASNETSSTGEPAPSSSDPAEGAAARQTGMAVVAAVVGVVAAAGLL
jgi:hypothetical protein